MRYEVPRLANLGLALDYVLTVGIYKNPIGSDNQVGCTAANGYCPGEIDE